MCHQPPPSLSPSLTRCHWELSPSYPGPGRCTVYSVLCSARCCTVWEAPGDCPPPARVQCMISHIRDSKRLYEFFCLIITFFMQTIIFSSSSYCDYFLIFFSITVVQYRLYILNPFLTSDSRRLFPISASAKSERDRQYHLLIKFIKQNYFLDNASNTFITTFSLLAGFWFFRMINARTEKVNCLLE